MPNLAMDRKTKAVEESYTRSPDYNQVYIPGPNGFDPFFREKM